MQGSVRTVWSRVTTLTDGVISASGASALVALTALSCGYGAARLSHRPKAGRR